MRFCIFYKLTANHKLNTRDEKDEQQMKTMKMLSVLHCERWMDFCLNLFSFHQFHIIIFQIFTIAEHSQAQSIFISFSIWNKWNIFEAHFIHSIPIPWPILIIKSWCFSIFHCFKVMNWREKRENKSERNPKIESVHHKKLLRTTESIKLSVSNVLYGISFIYIYFQLQTILKYRDPWS